MSPYSFKEINHQTMAIVLIFIFYAWISYFLLSDPSQTIANDEIIFVDARAPNNDIDTTTIDADEHLFDYIVVGSATGGVTAARLAEAGYKVLLIEAGPNDLTYSCTDCDALPFGDLLAGTAMLPYKGWFFTNVKQLNWQNTASMPSFWNANHTVLDRQVNMYRARMLGGCLSHNGLSWGRGSTRDYDFVAQHMDLPDWSFANVLPYFQKLETYLGENKTLRGSNGPLTMYQKNIKKWENKLQAVFDTAIKHGLPFNNHQNGAYSQYGIGFVDTNIKQYANNNYGLYNTSFYRESSSQSYIRDIGGLYDLTVWHNTTVQRVLFDNDNQYLMKSKVTPKAVGVEYWSNVNNNTLLSVYCKHEVIIAAGTYQSPQLLMLSGIGPKQQLNKFNITVSAHHKSYENIGKFGQDHNYFDVKYTLDMAKVAKNEYGGFTLKDGAITRIFANEGEVFIYLSSNTFDRLGLDYNDIYVHSRERRTGNSITLTIDTATYSKNLTIELRDLDSRIYPKVYNNYFSDSRDYDIIIAAIYELRKIFLSANNSVFVREKSPGMDKTVRELKEHIFRRSTSALHAVGTVSMGGSNEYAVNSNCELRGVTGLRVVDASIWPYSTNAGPMALVFMLGEKCAQHIIQHSH